MKTPIRRGSLQVIALRPRIVRPLGELVLLLLPQDVVLEGEEHLGHDVVLLGQQRFVQFQAQRHFRLLARLEGDHPVGREIHPAGDHDAQLDLQRPVEAVAQDEAADGRRPGGEIPA